MFVLFGVCVNIGLNKVTHVHWTVCVCADVFVCLFDNKQVCPVGPNDMLIESADQHSIDQLPFNRRAGKHEWYNPQVQSFGIDSIIIRDKWLTICVLSETVS